MDDEKLREETLFLAVTRPTMWLGVPIEASLPIALAACLGLCDAVKPPAKPNVLTMLCAPAAPHLPMRCASACSPSLPRARLWSIWR